MLKHLPRQKIRDQAADQIKQYIVSHSLLPGDRLPTEGELATRFGISRLSVREATKALEFLGIIESKTGVGLTVGHIDLDRVTEHLGFHPALHGCAPEQLIDTRVIIETGVLPHVAQRMQNDPSLATGLRQVVSQSRSARDLKSFITWDITFHRMLLDASGLSPLMAFGDLLHGFFERFRASVKRGEWKGGIDSHEKIVELLAIGNVEAATAELKQHIESHRDRLPLIARTARSRPRVD